jgi:hypothetical protein
LTYQSNSGQAGLILSSPRRWRSARSPSRSATSRRSAGCHEDLAGFVLALAADLDHDPEAWENRALETYLDSLRRFTTSLDSWARNNGQPVPVQPTWKLMARLLLIARTYE